MRGVAGLLVSFGARLGGGCTSGHGICGIARLSARSISATVIFMAAAIVTVAITRHGIGGFLVALTNFLCGLNFRFGLMISGMTQPAKVLGFLDIFGRWDSTFAFVRAATLVVSGTAFAGEAVGVGRSVPMADTH